MARKRFGDRYRDLKRHSATVDVPTELMRAVIGEGARWRRNFDGTWMRWSHFDGKWESGTPTEGLVRAAEHNPAVNEWSMRSDGVVMPYGAETPAQTEQVPQPAAPRPPPVVIPAAAIDILPEIPTDEQFGTVRRPSFVWHAVTSVTISFGAVFGGGVVGWMLLGALAAVLSLFSPWLVDEPPKPFRFDAALTLDLTVIAATLSAMMLFMRRFWSREHLPSPGWWVLALGVEAALAAAGYALLVLF